MSEAAPVLNKASRPGSRRALVAVLFVACLAATAVLPGLEPAPVEESLPPLSGAGLLRLPRPPLADRTYVVNTSGLERSEVFSLVSLQGIVNRKEATVYLNWDDPDRPGLGWFCTTFGGRDANITFTDLPGLLLTFKDRIKGIVVFDEQYPDTINLATTLAGLNDLLMCNLSRARELRDLVGVPITFDLGQGEWAGVASSADFYLRAFDRYFRECDQTTLATLNPHLWKSRDWAVSRRLFCFFLNPGPLAAPGEPEAFERLLRLTPDATELVGWMRSDVGIEENYGMQVISRYGKVLFPCEDTPNLSYTGALAGLSQQKPREQALAVPVLGDRTYVCFLMSDGDNTDYVNHFMRERWAEPERGTVPVGWGLPPALAEAAPNTIGYYYATATANDSFVAGSSGAAIMYPDYYPASRLPAFLERSRELMDRSGLESVWLINSYAAHEVPYSERTLSAYVDYLQPTGIFLDYGDVPVARPVWIQNGDFHSGVPVARSVHMWGSRENLVAKMLLDAAAKPSGPYFIFVTVHTWTMGLSDVAQAVADLRASPLGPTFDFVSPAAFLRLIQADMVRKAALSLANAENDRLTAALAGADLRELDGSLAQAREALEKNELARAAGLASEVDRRAAALVAQQETARFALAVVATVAACAAALYYFRRRIGASLRWPRSGVPTFGLLLAGTFLFFQSEYRVLFSNFWDWAVFIAVIPAALAALPCSGLLRRHRLGDGARLALAAGTIAAGSAIQLWTGWAAALVAFGFVSLLKELSPRLPDSGERALALAGTFALGCALLNAFPPRPAATAAGILWLGLFILWDRLRPSGAPEGVPAQKTGPASRQRLSDSYPVYMPAAFLALTTVSLYLTKKHYLMLTYISASSYLLNLGVMVPLGSLAIAALLAALAGKPRLRTMQPALILISGAGWLGVAFLSNPYVSSLLILMAQTAMLLLALFSLRAFLEGRLGAERFPEVGRNLVLLYIAANFLLLWPVLVYNLYLGKLPLSLNYVMYYFPLEFALFLFFGVLPFTVAAYHYHAGDRPEENRGNGRIGKPASRDRRRAKLASAQRTEGPQGAGEENR